MEIKEGLFDEGEDNFEEAIINKISTLIENLQEIVLNVKGQTVEQLLDKLNYLLYSDIANIANDFRFNKIMSTYGGSQTNEAFQRIPKLIMGSGGNDEVTVVGSLVSLLMALEYDKKHLKRALSKTSKSLQGE